MCRRATKQILGSGVGGRGGGGTCIILGEWVVEDRTNGPGGGSPRGVWGDPEPRGSHTPGAGETPRRRRGGGGREGWRGGRTHIGIRAIRRPDPRKPTHTVLYYVPRYYSTMFRAIDFLGWPGMWQKKTISVTSMPTPPYVLENFPKYKRKTLPSTTIIVRWNVGQQQNRAGPINGDTNVKIERIVLKKCQCVPPKWIPRNDIFLRFFVTIHRNLEIVGNLCAHRNMKRGAFVVELLAHLREMGGINGSVSRGPDTISREWVTAHPKRPSDNLRPGRAVCRAMRGRWPERKEGGGVIRLFPLGLDSLD